MNQEQAAITAILAATMLMFVLGKWRHDMVALGSLLACAAAGLIPRDGVFSGFGHPAVITVACVLVLSRGLQATGAVDALASRVLPSTSGTAAAIAALAGLGALLSAFMNNVGAMALLMPVAVQIAGKKNLPPGKILMPLAFGTILGGTATLIGTPPNLIVSSFRAEAGGAGFRMFDFSPVGLAVTFTGVAFMSLVGWRLVPARKKGGMGGFDTGAYLTEVRVVKDGKAEGETFRGVEKLLDEADAQVLAMIRGNVRVQAPSPRQLLREGDILIIEAEPESISSLLSGLGLKLEEEVAPAAGEEKKGKKNSADTDGGNGKGPGEAPEQEEIMLMEFVVMPYSRLIGRSATDIKLRSLYGLNLLALSRRGKRSVKRLRSTVIQGGDVLLMQGAPEALYDFGAEFRLAPLAKRSLSIPNRKLALKSVSIMAAAIGAAAIGGVPVEISFAAGVFALLVFRVMPLRLVYESIDWPVIVLLGAMLPVAGAVGSSGLADFVARVLIETVSKGHAVAGLAVILTLTMVLTDFMNNAATAAIMCPIAVSAAAQYGVNRDAFLMAVAIGASCAFLTPVGHQNNTLILGPGGFRFGDYWRLGLIIEILVIAVSLPVLMWIWPL